MNSGELKRAKRDVRVRVLAERDAMPEAARARASAVVAARLRSLPEIDAARAVLAFWSFGSELSTAGLIASLDADGVAVALPRIVDRELEARRYRPGDALDRTSFGAYEPSNGRALDPSTIDAIVVPGVAFDRDGRRVGYGGGFYDRFLPTTRPDAIRVGVAFDLQLAPPGEMLPAGSFDLRVDAVVTETELVRCPATR
jgi:5-formyltetrahydrofolate cyclo-ligase